MSDGPVTEPGPIAERGTLAERLARRHGAAPDASLAQQGPTGAEESHASDEIDAEAEVSPRPDQELVGSGLAFRTRLTIALIAAAVLPLAAFGLLL
ncbi:MAG TPA: hypothetical protein VGQ89_09480, partial [Candidatus Limnocylindrales bacterium]|nr:hypothetical protein [Candidatus Limnocylindrales bacterium]